MDGKIQHVAPGGPSGWLPVIGGLVLGLLGIGLPMIGVTINLWLGFSILAIAFALIAWGCWIWEGKSPRRALFRIITICTLAGGYFSLVGIQIHTQYVKDHPKVSQATVSQVTIPPTTPHPKPPEKVTKHNANSGNKSIKTQPLAPSLICKDNASCGISTGQTGGITAGTVFISPKPLPPRISAAQDGNAVTVTTTGLVEPASLVLFFNVDVDFDGDSVGTCMSCGNGRLNDSTGKPDMKTIWVFWSEPPFLPSRPLTVFFSSKLPATLLKVTDGPDGP